MAYDLRKLTFLTPCCGEKPLTSVIRHDMNADRHVVHVECDCVGGLVLDIDGDVAARCCCDGRLVIVAGVEGRFRTSAGPRRVNLATIKKSPASPASPGFDYEAAPTRREKVAAAMAGIAAGEHMKVTPHRRAGAGVIRQVLRETTMFHNFWMQQRHDVPLKAAAALSACDKVIASAEWSRQLREKVAASKHAEKHQVLCDIQDIE